VADTVEKGFCSPKRASSIQEPAPPRNVDSRIQSLRFDYCAFLFHSLLSATFSTVSTRSGQFKDEGLMGDPSSIKSSSS
jgi:hypothetical protein